MKRAGRWFWHYALPPLGLFLAILAVWQALVTMLAIPVYQLPSPSRVVGAAARHGGELALGTLLTAGAALGGFALSLLFGTLVALVFSQSKIIQRSIYPYAIFLQTVPIVAVAPIIITWFDYGFQSIVVIAFIIGLFPIITNATLGLANVDANLLELFAMHNASRLQVLFKLRVPNSIPYLVTGAKISCGLSVIGAIVGENYAGYSAEKNRGLGYLILQTSNNLQTDYLYASVLCSTLLGVAMFGAMCVAGDLIVGRWHAPGAKAEG